MNFQVWQCINYKREHKVLYTYIHQIQVQDIDAQADDTEVENARLTIPVQELALRGIFAEKPARFQRKTNAEQ